MKSLIPILIKLFRIHHESHHGRLSIKRTCTLVHSVYDETGKLVFSSNRNEAAEEFIAWFNLQHAEVVRGHAIPQNVA